MIVKYTVLILVLIKIALSYRQYKYHELCSGNKFKSIFDKITDNKPVVKLGQGVESAALIHYRPNSTNYMKIGSCEFNVKVDPGSGNGIFALIKNLKLRERTYEGYGGDSCVDYIRFTYKNGTSTRPICGHIETTVSNNLIRNFFDETSGEMRVEIFINSESSENSDTILVDLVFTAYSSCSWPQSDSMQVKCSPAKCISDVFTNDKILNCPPPGCSDESECVHHEIPQIVSVKTESSNSFSSGHIIVPVVIVVVVALIGILCFCKKKKATTNSQGPTEGNVEELRPTARSDLDSYLEFQDVRRVPIQPQYRPEEQHERHMPLVPPEQRYDRPMPMPLVPPEQRYDRPMPSAPPNAIRDDPPPYDALFSTPNKRANV